MIQFANILLTGTAYAMVLYIAAVGLSVTMGLLGIANLAHGAFAMAGGYLLIVLMTVANIPFAPALIAACLIVGLVSIILERVLYSRFYAAPELDQVVLSLGIIFISIAVAQFFFGALPLTPKLPPLLAGEVAVGPVSSFPLYRLFLIAIGLITFMLLWLGIERTILGAKIRATVDNRGMAQAIGVNTRRLFTLVFALGSMLAALGGGLGADLMAIGPDYALTHLTYFLIVVAIGGLGSIRGPFFAALLLGIGDTACRILYPAAGAFFVYIGLFLLLLFRPTGLFGRAA